MLKYVYQDTEGRMDLIAHIEASRLCGAVTPPSSKSAFHRALIAAALSDGATEIRYSGAICEDVLRTMEALRRFGTAISCEAGKLDISPIDRSVRSAVVDCGESGSSLRFLLPVAAVLGIETRFDAGERLRERPIEGLLQTLRYGGCVVERPDDGCIQLSGRLSPGVHAIPADVSSQYISGMLMALAAVPGESRLLPEGRSVSAPYIDLTIDVLRCFGADVEAENGGFVIRGKARLASPGTFILEGDPSAAAFWHCAAALPGNHIDVAGPMRETGDGCAPRLIEGIVDGSIDEIDLSDIPDLAAPLAAFAAAVGRRLTFTHAGRLRAKESDRLTGIADMVAALGASARVGDDSLTIDPCRRLTGGIVDPRGDHRLAMAAAVAACTCAGEVVLPGAECVAKSYPDFWSDYRRLGGRVRFSEA